MLHGQEGDHVVGQRFHAQRLEQHPAHDALQHHAQEEAAHKEQGLAPHVVAALEHPCAVPHKAVDHAQHIAGHIGGAVGEAQQGVEHIEGDQRDDGVAGANHSILE